MIGEMVKMDSELKEVKEKLCTLTASVGESKDEGQLNYTIKVILACMWERERSSYVKEIQFFNLDNLWINLYGVLSFPPIVQTFTRN